MRIKSEKITILNKIIGLGIEIFRLYNSLSNDSKMADFDNLKGLIDQEDMLYRSLNLTKEELEELVRYNSSNESMNEISKELDNLKESSDNSGYAYSYSLLRFLNRTKAMFIDNNYVVCGHIQCIIDELAQIQYSELLRASDEHPEFSSCFKMNAYLCLMDSKQAEKKAINNGLKPLDEYHDEIDFSLKSRLAENTNSLFFSAKYKSKYADALNKNISGKLDKAWENMCNIYYGNPTDFYSNPEFIASSIEFSSCIALYPSESRKKIYELLEAKIQYRDAEFFDEIENAFKYALENIVPRIKKSQDGSKTFL